MAVTREALSTPVASARWSSAFGRRGRPAGRIGPTLWVAAVPALATLSVCFYQLSLKNVLYGVHDYDDGVYLGAALRFVHGVVPYRDFVIVHPPGIVLLMAPVAELGRFFGNNVSLGLARELTALVASANVALSGLAVRHRGPVAVGLSATAMACFPMAPAADSTLFLEPYLIFFCALALALMFENGRLASPLRLALAGACMGFATSVKLWGAVLVITSLIACARRSTRALRPMVAGCAAGVAVPCLPFFVAAPGRFLRDVVVDQFERVASGSGPLTAGGRILWLSGLSGLTVIKAHAGIAILLAVASLAVALIVVARARHRLLPADVVVLGGAVGSALIMWAPPQLYAHYMYFPAAFIAMSVGVLFGLASERHRASSRSWPRSGGYAVCGLALAMLIPQQASYARTQLTGMSRDPTVLNVFIPPDACIVSDDTVVEISADLFTPYRLGCPSVVDAFGTWLADGPGIQPSARGLHPIAGAYRVRLPGGFVAEWAQWLSRADYVVEQEGQTPYIPWTPVLRAWFSTDFRLTASLRGAWVYKHVLHTPPPAAA